LEYYQVAEIHIGKPMLMCKGCGTTLPIRLLPSLAIKVQVEHLHCTGTISRAGQGRQATANDRTTDLPAQAHLRGFFHEAAAELKPGAADNIDYSWSGIVSFTQDGVPFVDGLPFPGRSHQFVLGAYHAAGMVNTGRPPVF
jgi:glycine/D-amino acid oxidase-like deaminating enzyme